MGAPFNSRDHRHADVGDVFQNLNAFVVNVAPNTGIGDVAERCPIDPNNEVSACARQDHNLVRSILRNPIKGIDNLGVSLRRESQGPAVAVEFDNQHTVGIPRQLQASIGGKVVSLKCLHSVLLSALPCLRSPKYVIARSAHCAQVATTRPPAARMISPVIQADSSDARNTATGAISVTRPSRPSGVFSARTAPAPPSKVPAAILPSVSVWPGAIALTRILRGASSSANPFVSVSMAPFVEAYSRAPATGCEPTIELRLMMLPPQRTVNNSE